MYKVENNKGAIRITSDVFTTLAGLAATNCFGVKGMAFRSMADGIVHLLKRESMAKGVHVKVDERGGITIELHIIIDNGVNIPAITEAIKSEVSYKIKEATGVTVNNVNIFVDAMVVG